jgi:hypothetical protein
MMDDASARQVMFPGYDENGDPTTDHRGHATGSSSDASRERQQLDALLRAYRPSNTNGATGAAAAASTTPTTRSSGRRSTLTQQQQQNDDIIRITEGPSAFSDDPEAPAPPPTVDDTNATNV